MNRLAFATLALLALATTRADAGLTKGRTLETGQTTNYGAGSDGELRRGLARVFTDLGDGVIKDNRTGLIWEKKTNDGSIHDVDNLYSWSTGAPWQANGTAFTTFLATLNSIPCFNGNCDWRLPNLNELESIRNLGASFPAAFLAFDQNCPVGCTNTQCSCTTPGGYLSSSTVDGTPSEAWVVRFNYGGSYQSTKTDLGYVRAVRGGF